jgi:protein O-mannosyl-transferase
MAQPIHKVFGGTTVRRIEIPDNRKLIQMKTHKLLPSARDNRLARSGKRQEKRLKEPSRQPDKLSGATLPNTSRRLFWAAGAAICLATLAVYLQTSVYGFIGIDDGQYVSGNPMVKAGLTATGFAWAFTTFSASNWHPLTWLSLMLDSQLFGVNAGADHLVNLALHLANSLLLFIVCAKMTRRPWRSLIVAGIFALHPLHVESVAWIAERKDVLSTFFGMLALLFYIRYAEAATTRRYVAVASFFGLSLLAKPMLVTFPLLLLLLDFWPLRRIEWPPQRPRFKRLLLEKLPLLAMAAASCVVTVYAQRSEAMVSIEHISIPARFANATVAYARYLGAAFWPSNLAVFYPFHTPQAPSVLVAAVILVGVTWAFARRIEPQPYLMVGWLWFLGMLVPVIGILQAGSQSMADRYMYLPAVGLSIAVIWGATDLLESRAAPSYWGSGLAGIVLLLFSIGAYRQVGYWKDSRTLFERTLAVTEGNFLIENNMALIMAEAGRHDDATRFYRNAIAVHPEVPEPHVNIAQELMASGKPDEALIHLTEALRLKPDIPLAHMDLALLLASRGKMEDANLHLNELLRLSTGDAVAQSYLCFVFRQLGRLDDAIAHCSESLRLDPDLLYSRFNLAVALAAQGKKSEAIVELSRVLAINPSYPDARSLLKQLQSAPSR